MILDRRKALIYLCPDISASEHFADTKTETHHHDDRGDTSCMALLAGLALGEADSRLSSTLAALLTEDTRLETLHKTLTSFLEIQLASFAPAITPATVPVKASEPPTPTSKNASIRNLAGSLPD